MMGYCGAEVKRVRNVRIIAHSVKSVGHVFILLKESINIRVVKLIVSDVLFIVLVF